MLLLLKLNNILSTKKKSDNLTWMLFCSENKIFYLMKTCRNNCTGNELGASDMQGGALTIWAILSNPILYLF